MQAAHCKYAKPDGIDHPFEQSKATQSKRPEMALVQDAKEKLEFTGTLRFQGF
jgi:hypothetical protein